MTDTKSNTPQVTHYADDATLAHIAELERQLAEARRLLVEAKGAAMSDAKDKPIGYIDAEQIHRWESLKGTQYESPERCYMPWSSTPFKSDMNDCSIPVYSESALTQAHEKGRRDGMREAKEICRKEREGKWRHDSAVRAIEGCEIAITRASEGK